MKVKNVDAVESRSIQDILVISQLEVNVPSEPSFRSTCHIIYKLQNGQLATKTLSLLSEEVLIGH